MYSIMAGKMKYLVMNEENDIEVLRGNINVTNEFLQRLSRIELSDKMRIGNFCEMTVKCRKITPLAGVSMNAAAHEKVKARVAELIATVVMNNLEVSGLC
jgi:hypothetical protein